MNYSWLWIIFMVGCGTESRVQSPCTVTSGTVVRVIDGDTVELMGGQKVRYLLVDTPELGSTAAQNECFALEAKQFNETWVMGKDVVLRYDANGCTDMFGRLLAYVSVDGQRVNPMLIERGYGRVWQDASVTENRFGAEFLALQKDAQRAYAGLWGACR